MTSRRKGLTFVMLLLVSLCVLTLQGRTGIAATRKNQSTPSPNESVSNKNKVPVNLGVGPALFSFGPPMHPGAEWEGSLMGGMHPGLRLTMVAVLSKEYLQRNKTLIPKQYRSAARQMHEVRIRPLVAALIPTSVILSPKNGGTCAYGATWHLLAASISLAASDPVRISLGAGLLATYAYLESLKMQDTTHFIRPGIDLKLEAEFTLSPSFLISAGWASQMYLPQMVKSLHREKNASLWHIGQAFLMFHLRVPMAVPLK